MLSVLLLSLLVPVTGAATTGAATISAVQQDPPIEVWLSKRDVRLGDRVRVHARTDTDGYLVVLHAEPDGRVRVLFPLDPGQDNFVRGGEKYELRGRGDRDAFRVYTSDGIGTVYAAFSRDPFTFDGLVRADHWDYGLPDTWRLADDGEAELTNLAQRMASGVYFDYDFVEYDVGPARGYAAAQGHLSLYGPGYYPHYGYYSSPRLRIWLHLGYNPYRSIGFGFYDPVFPFWYDPFYYDPFYYDSFYYDRFYYGFGGGFYGGYYPVYPTTRFYRTRRVFVVNDRLRSTPRIRPVNGASRGRRVFTASSGSSVRRVTAQAKTTPTTRQVTATRRRTIRPQAVRTTPTRRVTEQAQRRNLDATRRTPQVDTQRPRARPTATVRTRQQSRPERKATPTRRTPTTRANPTRQTQVKRRATPTGREPQARKATPASRATATPRTKTRVTPTLRRRTQPQRSVRPSSRTATRSRAVTPRRTSIRTSRPTVRPSTRSVRRTPTRSVRSSPVRRTPVRKPGGRRNG